MEDKRKQIPLRISSKLFDDLYVWAESEFRSINGQIEYILTQAVKKHKREKDDDKKENEAVDQTTST